MTSSHPDATTRAILLELPPYLRARRYRSTDPARICDGFSLLNWRPPPDFLDPFARSISWECATARRSADAHLERMALELMPSILEASMSALSSFELPHVEPAFGGDPTCLARIPEPLHRFISSALVSVAAVTQQSVLRVLSDLLLSPRNT